MKLTGYILFLCAILFFSACKKEDASCGYGNSSTVAPVSETDSLRKILIAKGITATQHAKGFFYIINSAGSGSTPSVCSYVSTKYKGSFLSNDVVFDPSPSSGNIYSTGSFTLGQLIDGCAAGLQLIKNQGHITLFIPPSLGYGSAAYPPNNPVIPGGSYLKFEFTLDAVQ